ncbi:condensation domain-containing protein [Streptomyces jeddahensis]|uniref:condensation domain-containing protein n=1 Tax=Streptomyces jeddahensis TaxID=1716141 RepID=UPI00082F4E33|nr:condensation domain-containing protein [Streptomyces jeddahensis]
MTADSVSGSEAPGWIRCAPATPNQAQLYLLQSLSPDNPFYNVAISVRIRGSLNGDRLSDCLSVLVDRHEALRTGFRLDDEGSVVQWVAAPQGWSVERVHADSDAEVQEVAKDAARRVFDLARPPLIRAILMRRGVADHTLILVFHHIVIDAWSVGILFDELSALYGAEGPPSAIELPPAVSPLDTVKDVGPAGLLDYWVGQLTPAPGNAAVAGQDHFVGAAGALHTFHVPEELAQSVRREAARRRCSSFIIMLSALRMALGRRTSRHDLTIGCPIAGRTDQRLEQAVGFFANTLPIRTVIPPDADPDSVVEAVRSAALDAFDHQAVPLASIVSRISPVRDIRRNPLFDVTCQQQNAADQRLILPGAVCEFRHVDKGTTQFTLSLDIYDDGQRFECTFEYATEALDRGAVHAIEQAFLDALQELCEVAFTSATPSADNGVRALEPSPAAHTPHPLGRVPEALHRALAQDPARPALVAGDRAWNCAELLAEVDKAMAELNAAGVQPGQNVAVASPRSADGVVRMLAIFLLGAAYCPLDERMSAEGLDSVIRGLCPAAIVGSDADIWRDLVRSLTSTPGRSNPGEAADDTAYIVHTSGSTGAPKQVAVSYRAFAAYLDAVRRAYRLGPDDRVLHFAATGFDVAIEEVVPTLLAGGTVVVAPAELAAEPEGFLSFVRDHGITVANLPSSFWHRMTEELRPRADVAPGSALPLRLAVLGSEPLRPASVLRWRNLGYDGVQLLHAYGVSEGTVTVAVRDLTDFAIGSETERLPIGRPLDHVELLVLDEDEQPVAPGEPGRLVLSGAAVSWPASQTGSVLHTGDAARVLPDGDVELLGRIDRKFKRRGVLVDPDGIERALTTHAQVTDALVVPRADGQLVAVLEVPDTHRRNRQASDAARVLDWSAIHDDEAVNDYDADGDPLLNISGWTSAIHRTPLSARVMRSWADNAAAGIRRFRPQRILEIGCGTGMLLLQLAADCERYVGIDVSKSALDHVERTIRELRPDLAHVELFLGSADELGRLGVQGPFDAVVIHSVAQYFPSVEYLESLLGTLAPLFAEQAVVHVGDVRNPDLVRALYREQVLADTTPRDDVELIAEIETLVNREEELLIPPRWFTSAGRGTSAPVGVETFARPPWPEGELNRYRFDARLFYGDWEQSGTPAICSPDVTGLERALAAAHDVVVIPNRPLPQLGKALGELTRMYAEAGLASLLPPASGGPVDEVDVWREWYVTAAQHGYQVLLPYAEDSSRVDVTFVRRDARSASSGMLLTEAGFFLPRTAWAAGSRRPNDPLRRESLTALLDEVVGAAAAVLTTESVPTSSMVLERFPRSSDGQLARRPLAELAARGAVTLRSDDSGHRQPNDPVGEAWCAVLGQSYARHTDNFFACGGDSILALRLVARLGALGYSIGPALLFRNQTLGALRDALSASEHAVPHGTDPEPSSRPEPDRGERNPADWALTPMAQWFREQDFPDPAHYQQARLLVPAAGCDTVRLCEGLKAVLGAHGAPEPRVINADEGDEAWQRAVAAARQEISDQDPTVFRVVTGHDATGRERVALFAHHLIVDAVSWNMLLDRLDAWLHRPHTAEPPGPTVRQWVEGLRAAVREAPQEHEMWRRLLASPAHPLFAKPAGGDGRLRWFTETVPRVRPGRAGRADGAEALLLAAVGQALTRWKSVPAVIVDREGHGRDALDDNASNVLGWLAATHPVLLGERSTAEDVQHTLRDLASVGTRFLTHRFLSEEPLPPSPAEVCFTYLGRRSQEGYGHFTVAAADVASELLGEDVAETNVSAYALDLVVEGNPWTEELAIRYAVDSSRVSDAEAREFGRLLVSAVTRLVSDEHSVEDLEVTPTQAAMVLHTAARPDSLVGVEHTVITLGGRIDPERFRSAVEAETQRHELLRSSFHLDSAEPRRRVEPRVPSHVHIEDLTGLPTREQLRRIDSYANEDLEAGFDLSRPPAVRWGLFLRSAELASLVWTHHHAVLDGAGSWALLAAVLEQTGTAPTAPAREPRRLPSAQHVPRRARHDTAAERHWASQAGKGARSLLLFGDRPLPSAIGRELDVVRRNLDTETLDVLRHAAAEHGITVGTICLAAWSLVLMATSGRHDVVVGTSVSHEPETDGDGPVVGMHVTTVPVFCRIEPGHSVADWLGEFQCEVADGQYFGYVGETAIRRYMGLRGRLYDNHFVFQNYARPEHSAEPDAIRVLSARTVTRTGQPMTLVVDDSGPTVSVELVFDRTVVERPAAATLLTRFVENLGRLATEPGASAAELTGPRIMLPQAEEAAPQEPDATEDSRESKVRKVLADLLGVPDVHPDANFFDIGARSILLVEARQRLTAELGLAFPITHFFEFPTVRALVEALESESNSMRNHESRRADV